MIRCKKETPIQSNEYLYQRNNKDCIELDNSQGIEINRYIFTFEDNMKLSRISSLVRKLALQLNSDVYSLISWEEKPKGSKIQGMIIERKLRRANYRINKNMGHYTAIKKINNINEWSFEINTWEKEILIFGDTTPNEILKYINNNDTLFMAINKNFIPTKRNIEFLQKNNISMLYTVYDDFGNIEIVLITKNSIDLE